MESETAGTEAERSEAEFETLGWKRQEFSARFDGVWRGAEGFSPRPAKAAPVLPLLPRCRQEPRGFPSGATAPQLRAQEMALDVKEVRDVSARPDVRIRFLLV